MINNSKKFLKEKYEDKKKYKVINKNTELPKQINNRKILIDKILSNFNNNIINNNKSFYNFKKMNFKNINIVSLIFYRRIILFTFN